MDVQRRGIRGRANRATARQMNRSLLSNLHGHANRLNRTEPPPYTRAPFQDLTVAIKVTELGEVTLSTKDICTFLTTQLGLDAVTTIEKIVFKLRRVDAYANAVGSSANAPKVKMVCNSLIPTSATDGTKSAYPEIKRLEDTGNLSRNAVVSYSWPLSQSDMCLAQDPDVTVVNLTTFATNSTELRVHVNWSFKA